MSHATTATKASSDTFATFVFTPENLTIAKQHLAKYPPGRQASAVIPLLHLAQQQVGQQTGSGGWLPVPVMDYVADLLGMAPMRVYEVASFYEMFRTQPTGKYLVQVCRTTPCWLRGSDEVLAACEKHLHIKNGATTADNIFTLGEFECLGGCANAPVVMVNGDAYYEDLCSASIIKVLDDLKAGRNPAPGSVKGRQGSKP